VEPITAVVNTSAGTARAVLEVLRADPRVTVRETAPAETVRVVTDLAERGVGRVIVAGGDGTVSAAAAALAGRRTPLAVVPAGTLNHFAQSLSIPTEPRAALEVALGGTVARADAGFVNGRLFLGTSSIGTYVAFVQTRNRLKRRLGYYLASAAAGAGTLARLRTFGVRLEAGGQVRDYRTPIVFVGVGERELSPPGLGEPKPDGRRGLHVLVARRTTRLGLAVMGVRALVRGVRPWGREREVESFVVRECAVSLGRAHGRATTDGEVVPVHYPLRYEYRPDALAVIVPKPT
jgi:diacylglycerol kinase family enzyme